MFDDFKKYWREYPLLKILLFAMGIMIVVFNVKGYDELFSDEPWFGLASPFGILLGLAELAVLVWTSAVISSWPNASRVLKFSTYLLVPAFMFLCYSGINSYLSSLATQEIRLVKEVRAKNDNSEQYRNTIESEVNTLREQLAMMRPEREEINSKIAETNEQINAMSQAASDRRLKALDCNAVPDCRDSVSAFENQAQRLNNELGPLYSARDRLDNRIAKADENLENALSEIRQQKLSETNAINEHAGIESSFDMKKAAYERIILSIASFIGIEVEDPFSVFVAVLSGVIYPVYFILNLFLALNSKENLSVRKVRREKRAKTHELLSKLVKIKRLKLLRRKKMIVKQFEASLLMKAEKATKREMIYTKMMRYFRVWAHRRTKVIEREVEKIVVNEIQVEVEVEKIIEVPVEIEKEVEVIKEVTVEVEVEKIVEVVKEIPVEVRVEVPVEVDRVVKVPTEVPVFVEKIKKEPEPFFIKDPQVIIHERIIPVPDNITGPELEKLLNAKHGSDRAQSVDESEISKDAAIA